MTRRYLHPSLCWLFGHEPVVRRDLARDTYECSCGRNIVTGTWVCRFGLPRLWGRFVKKAVRPR